MKTLLKITALLCALLLTLTLFSACTKGGKTTDTPADATPSASESNSPAPSPVPPSEQGQLSVGGKGSLPAFEW